MKCPPLLAAIESVNLKFEEAISTDDGVSDVIWSHGLFLFHDRPSDGMHLLQKMPRLLQEYLASWLMAIVSILLQKQSRSCTTWAAQLQVRPQDLKASASLGFKTDLQDLSIYQQRLHGASWTGETVEDWTLALLHRPADGLTEARC